MDDHELMRVRADTAFTYDAHGRMLLSNEPRVPERRPAPRLWLAWTPTGYVVRFGATVSDALAQQIEAILERRPPTGGLHAAPAALPELRAALEPHAAIAREEGGPAYRFPETIAPAGDAVRLTEANRTIAHQTFPWLYVEYADWWPAFAVVRDGAAVSVCFSSRMGVRACEAGVETLPAFRGHGYAGAVTAAWAAAVRAASLIPIYSTSWENRASQAVARKLGLIPFGANLSWA
ncbi:MAG TPA: GNAT family N-acetyltransferase [Dehalococcoidia bacterium]|nr:GNAT family N-acetyltransferase [Dehalococcoidia bacterium]